jgi:hypothetical protein
MYVVFFRCSNKLLYDGVAPVFWCNIFSSSLYHMDSKVYMKLFHCVFEVSDARVWSCMNIWILELMIVQQTVSSVTILRKFGIFYHMDSKVYMKLFHCVFEVSDAHVWSYMNIWILELMIVQQTVSSVTVLCKFGISFYNLV